MTTATRSLLLELRAERTAMGEGFRLLDDKRLLLAGELLRELARHAQLWRAFAADCGRARAALREALERHGIEGLQCYPAERRRELRLARRERRLFGVRLQEVEPNWRCEPAAVPAHASAEAERARLEFRALLGQAAVLAALGGNLRRLAAEYRRTQRRARALEEVLIPELSAQLHAVAEQIDEGEQEDAILPRRASPPVRSGSRLPSGGG